ncbi:hypothetical protein, variant [Verruconis gallopava]|nr:hypothetical protein, variant [Verruconis gallopava]KIW04144.1 hypothetical protein, variant [Verruconis gallopava]
MSFGPGHSDTEEAGEGSTVITPKKPFGRQSIQRNAERKSLRPTRSPELLPLRDSNSDRPSYSKDSLAELKLSTPSTPRDISHHTSEDEEPTQSLDVISKFGVVTSRPAGSVIPTEAEIKEKKDRRARLAQEKEFISLNAEDSDEERRELLLRPREKYAETRLVRDDEDIAEGFDDYVEDGKIALGRKALREEKIRKRREMAELIAEAEGAGDNEEEDDSEAERNEAYEATQTRAGTYGQRRVESEHQYSRTPPKITPVPDLNAVLDRIKDELRAMQDAKAFKLHKLEELKVERKEIAEREVWIQAQLKEVGERYEKLKVEAGMTDADLNGGSKEIQSGRDLIAQRGLESYGSTPIAMSEVNSDEG